MSILHDDCNLSMFKLLQAETVTTLNTVRSGYIAQPASCQACMRAVVCGWWRDDEISSDHDVFTMPGRHATQGHVASIPHHNNLISRHKTSVKLAPKSLYKSILRSNPNQ